MDSIKSLHNSNGCEESKIMWRPQAENHCKMEKFRIRVNKKFGLGLKNYHELWKWSTESYSEFWEMFWSESGIIFSQNYKEVVDRKLSIVDNPEWFRGARLNYAENLLKYKDDKIAVYSAGEQRPIKTYTYKELGKLVSMYASALRALNVETGDRVVGYIPNCVEALIAMLAAASIGAIWSSTSPDFGVMIIDSDAIVVVSAEYNHSIPPALANLLDHFGGSSYAWKPSGIVCYSPGQYGGMRAAMQLRAMLGELGCISVSNIFGIPKVHQCFDESGEPTESKERTLKNCDTFLKQVEWWAEAANRQRNAEPGK